MTLICNILGLEKGAYGKALALHTFNPGLDPLKNCFCLKVLNNCTKHLPKILLKIFVIWFLLKVNIKFF